MSENSIFRDSTDVLDTSGKKPVHTAALVLGILSLVLALLIPIAGEILGIIGIVKSVRNRYTHSTTAALVCSIIGLVLAVLTHVLNFLALMSMAV